MASELPRDEAQSGACQEAHPARVADEARRIEDAYRLALQWGITQILAATRRDDDGDRENG